MNTVLTAVQLLEHIGFQATRIRLVDEKLVAEIMSKCLRVTEKNLQKTLFNYFTLVAQKNVGQKPVKVKEYVVNDKLDPRSKIALNCNLTRSS